VWCLWEWLWVRVRWDLGCRGRESWKAGCLWHYLQSTEWVVNSFVWFILDGLPQIPSPTSQWTPITFVHVHVGICDSCCVHCGHCELVLHVLLAHVWSWCMTCAWCMVHVQCMWMLTHRLKNRAGRKRKVACAAWECCTTGANTCKYLQHSGYTYHFNQFTMGLEILKIYEPWSGIGCEKWGQTLFFNLPVMCDQWIKWNGTVQYPHLPIPMWNPSGQVRAGGEWKVWNWREQLCWY